MEWSKKHANYQSNKGTYLIDFIKRLFQGAGTSGPALHQGHKKYQEGDGWGNSTLVGLQSVLELLTVEIDFG